MTVYGGLVKIITDEGVVGGLPATFATGPILGIDVSVWLLLATLVGAVGLMGYTPLGRKILAIGSSPRASKLVGISRGRTWVSAFAVAGVLVGLAAMLELAQNRTMQPTMGKGYELRAITAAVIGGVAIEGGRGSVVGVLLGALLLVLIENGLVLWSVPGTRYDLVIGSLLLLAVAIGRWNRRSPS
jgi:ribose/xylose/arabinose/galactoside ABC-type transport system permease subunit